MAVMFRQQNPKNSAQMRLAQHLMRQGTDSSPIQSPWQGIGRMAQAAAGAYMQRKSSEADKAERGSALAALLSGMKPGKLQQGMELSDMGNEVSPNALADSGEAGMPGMPEQQAQMVMPKPLSPGGMAGGAEAMAGLPDNYYAQQMAPQLALAAQEQQMAQAAELAAEERAREIYLFQQQNKSYPPQKPTPPKTIKTAEGVYILEPDGTLGARLGGAKADTEINLGGDLTKGFRRTETGDAEVIPGGSRDPKVIKAAKSAERQATLDSKNIEKLPGRRAQIMATVQNAPAFTDAVAEAKRLAGSDWTSGVVQQVLGGVAGTPAFGLERQLDTIKSNIGFGELIRIKESGGTLGALSEMENRLLQAMQGALDPRLSGKKLIEALDRVEKIHKANLVEKQEAFKKMYPNEDRPWENDNRSSGGVKPDNIDQSVWDEMTPEEKALF